MVKSDPLTVLRPIINGGLVEIHQKYIYVEVVAL